MRLRPGLLPAAAFLVSMSAPAQAERLYSIWQLNPTTETGERTVTFKNIILEQQLVPFKAARLSEDAVTGDGKTIPAATPLFLVFQDDGEQAFCTMKDRSSGNAAKSLFIPALDKRPCFVDRDRDGRFDVAFNVFDKYGSALAPSGDLKKAVGLRGGGTYVTIPGADFPSPYRFIFVLDGKREAAKARIDVSFDNGSGKPELGVARNERIGNAIKVLNTRFEVAAVSGETARLSIVPDREALVMGESGGTFGITPAAPKFLDTNPASQEGNKG